MGNGQPDEHHNYVRDEVTICARCHLSAMSFIPIDAKQVVVGLVTFLACDVATGVALEVGRKPLFFITFGRWDTSRLTN